MNINLVRPLFVQQSISNDLSRVQASNARSSARLSSGSKLEEASTDPAGYAVSLKLRHTSSVLGSVESNLLGARSFLEAQSSALSAINTAVQRLDEISTLMKDPTKSAADNYNYNVEADQMREQIAELQQSSFNGKGLFVFFTGGVPDTNSVALDASGNFLQLSQPDFSADPAWGELLGWTPPYRGAGAGIAQDLIDYSNAGGFEMIMSGLSTMVATNAAEQGRVDYAIDRLRTKATGLAEARSRITDVDVATEVTRLNRSSLLLDSGASMLAQANLSNEMVLKVLGI